MRTTRAGTPAAAPLAMSTGRTSGWHSLSVQAATRELNVNAEQGLGRADAELRLQRSGANVLAEAKPRSALSILAHQFESIMAGLLVAASVLAFVLRNTLEGIAIAIVIVLNALIGFVTEWQAARTLATLRRHVVTNARVRRDGQEHQIPAAELAPGDIIVLAAGDRVPADGRVLDEVQLHVDEAALTGESVPTPKSADAVADVGAALADQSSMVHMGTAVTGGRGTVVVTATGARTELGKVGALVLDVAKQGSPLETKLSKLSRALLVLVLVLCALIVLVGWLRGHELYHMVEVGISLAISAIPEGLLAVTTMTLAVGMQRMARMHALVRRLPAVEALGSATVVCTDKTGTLTRNEMTVCAFSAGGQRYEVTGTGYTVEGRFTTGGQEIEPLADSGAHGPLRMALQVGALCNDAQLELVDGRMTALGDPTEAALLVAAAKAGLDLAALARASPRSKELPFTSETKRMVTVHGTPAIAYVKGAPASVLNASTRILGAEGVKSISPDERRQVLAENDALAATALRMLGLAYREVTEGEADAELASGLIFVGLVGMIDPLRPEAKRTIDVCRGAGIRTVMITGDQQLTATEIARQLGLDVAPDGRTLRTVHARELAGLDLEGWQAIVGDASVFARVSAAHKLEIVAAFQRLGHIVAMTGDGVNDAPALRKADIGIAMGVRGTEVAKDAADMIIADDDFATIVRAVEQGRIVSHNIRRFIHYLFSTNVSELATVFAAIALGWPLPLGVLQILWLNLVADVFPAMALALEPSAADVMTQPPRDPGESLITLRLGFRIAWQGALLAACALTAFTVARRWYGGSAVGVSHASTVAFLTLAFAQVIHAFNSRSRTRSAFFSGAFANPWLWGATALCFALHLSAIFVPFLRRVLGTQPLRGLDWALVAAGSLAPLLVVECTKLVLRIASALREARPGGSTRAPRDG